jgi:hypothetical protein
VADKKNLTVSGPVERMAPELDLSLEAADREDLRVLGIILTAEGNANADELEAGVEELRKEGVFDDD